ncbi:hypothetical protein MHC_04510 [Mycoplasma haemocanis str. Illinois]|uniref:Uncharacterized protein n=1 Tax=Mycoplasma haemocanis (strain Illinois) TaxID=1111676 RepID=H6N7Y6_MYCHN|nr:hypothetical protein MHC_04510 [Mycoplasma haemocanis str. Illinois]
MANPLFFKSLAGIGGVSVAAGAAIGIPKLLEDKGKLVSELIKEKDPGKRLITSKSLDDPYWKKAWEDYRKVNKDAAKGQDAFKLFDWGGQITTSITSTEAPQSLVNSCSFNTTKRVSHDSQLYKNVLKYCTRDSLISDLIKDSGKTPLLKSEDASSSEWKAAWERYRLANQGSEDAWKLSGFSGQKNRAS